MDRRRSAVYLIIVLSLLAGLITGKAFFFNIAYAFIGLLVLSFLWAWSSVNWLHLRRHTHARRAQVGNYLEEQFTVRNTSVLPKLWLEVYDQSTLPAHRASHIISSLRPRKETTWQALTPCLQRGVFQLGPLQIVGGDPFGLFQAERRIEITSPLVVYPPMTDLPDFTLPHGLLPGGDALHRRAYQVTTNAAGIRDYAPGDGLSRIHWLSTARRDRLIVKEFELDPLSDIYIMLDGDRAVHYGEYSPTEEDFDRVLNEGRSEMGIPATTEEYAVAVCASLARYFLQRERAVGFSVYGQRRETIPADHGARQLSKVLESLAIIRTLGVMPFDQFMTFQVNQLARGTTVMLVTPSTREGWVTAAHAYIQRGLRVIAVLIDAGSFGGRPGAGRLATRLRTISVPAYIVRNGDDLRLALSHPQA